MTYNCDKIKTKITVLNKGFVHLDPFSLPDPERMSVLVFKLLSLIYKRININDRMMNTKNIKDAHITSNTKYAKVRTNCWPLQYCHSN